MKEKQIHIRVTDEEKEKIEKNARLLGFRQTSEYLRFLGLLNIRETTISTVVLKNT